MLEEEWESAAGSMGFAAAVASSSDFVLQVPGLPLFLLSSTRSVSDLLTPLPLPLVVVETEKVNVTANNPYAVHVETLGALMRYVTVVFI